MNKYQYAVFKWADKSFGNNVSLSSIKVKLNEDEEFLSARFMILTQIDLNKILNTDDSPLLPIWVEETNFFEFTMENAIQVGGRYLRRYYDIGVPFEIVSNKHSENQLTYKFANQILSLARQISLEFLEQSGNITASDGEIARVELSVRLEVND